MNEKQLFGVLVRAVGFSFSLTPSGSFGSAAPNGYFRGPPLQFLSSFWSWLHRT